MSSADVAVKVEGLGKRYQIGAAKASYRTIRESVTDAARAAAGWLRPRRPGADSPPSVDLWALRDVNFEIPRGQAVGIIGRNGAGKSTLLKVLSRITAPTTGSVELAGRVGSLLEVGTGFHPELTGRENIYLNGAILGMARVDIRRKFNEIVAFSEVEKFLDTPVKRYSSGMYTRLAFAVAAHMDPDILIVDEVLAVGDAQFQQKCLGKMNDVAAHGGRTVLFVSHQMGSIAQLCPRAILMRHGQVASEGPTQTVIAKYLSEAMGDRAGFTAVEQPGKEMYVARVETTGADGNPTTNFTHLDPIRVAITCRVNKPTVGAELGFYVIDQRNRKVFTTFNLKLDELRPREGYIHATAALPVNFLVPGEYRFTFAISVPHQRTIDWVDDAVAVTIVDGGSAFSAYEGGDYGCVFADCTWSAKLSDAPPSPVAALG